MTTPSGTIGASNINTELGRSTTATLSLNDAGVRSLAGIPSGTIAYSSLRGKSNLPTLTHPPGTYDAYGSTRASFTMGSSADVIWNTSPNNASPFSGTASTQWTASIQAVPRNSVFLPRSITFSVTAYTIGGTYLGAWTINLYAEGTQ
jgi:hypothetical protein